MKVECTKERLSRALTKAERITSKNSTLPVLSCVLLKTQDSSLVISATNLDIGIEISIPVKVITPGTVAVPGSIISQFVNGIFNDKNITLELEAGNLKISTDHTKTVIKCFPVDDFPSIPKITSEYTFTIPTGDFLKGLKSVSYSASLSTIKPVLSSVYMYPEEEFIVFVATDSFRLAEKKIKVKKTKEFNQILLPFKNIVDITRVFDGVEGELEVVCTENQISIVYDDIYLTSRVIDGSFPSYTQLIPSDSLTQITLLKQDLINTLKISNIFTDKFSQIFLSVSSKDNMCEIRTRNADVGENSSTIDAVVKGQDIAISFNYKYIADCFQSLESDSLILSCNGPSKPMIIRGIHDKTFTYVVMPMNKQS